MSAQDVTATAVIAGAAASSFLLSQEPMDEQQVDEVEVDGRRHPPLVARQQVKTPSALPRSRDRIEVDIDYLGRHEDVDDDIRILPRSDDQLSCPRAEGRRSQQRSNDEDDNEGSPPPSTATKPTDQTRPGRSKGMKATLNRRVSSTEEEGGDRTTSVKRRRSTRDRNRLVVDKASLFYRRMQELFFDGDNDGDSVGPSDRKRTGPEVSESAAEESDSEGDDDHDTVANATCDARGTSREAGVPHQQRRTARRIGHHVLHQVYQYPNVYVIDNFLGESDLAYFRTRIGTGTFQRSYVDGPSSSTPSSDDNGVESDKDDDDDDKEQSALTCEEDGAESDGDDGAKTPATRSRTNPSRSFVDRRHRTSTFLSFDKQEDAKIAAIEKRASELLGCWSSRTVEPLQLVRYEPGQFFNVHHDLADYDDETGHVELPPKSLFFRRRVVTLFCYLNDVEEGGETAFPSCPVVAEMDSSEPSPSASVKAVDGSGTAGEAGTDTAPSFGIPSTEPSHSDPVPSSLSPPVVTDPSQSHLSATGSSSSSAVPPPPMSMSTSSSSISSSTACLLVKPKPGRAVLWSNVRQDGHPDPRTVHAGLPVRRGTKYGINIWICEG